MIAVLGLDGFHALEIELEVVAQATVEHAGAGAAGIGCQHLAGAGHADHRAGHGIEHVFAMRLGDDDTVGIDRRHRIDRKILHPAIGEIEPDGLGFLLGRGGGDIGGRGQRAVDDPALAGAGARAARKRLQQPGAAALRGGRKHVVADVDGPGALADRDAGQCGLIIGIHPPLCRGVFGRGHEPGPGAKAEKQPQTGRDSAGSDHESGIPNLAARWLAELQGHLNRNIRQTTRISRKTGLSSRRPGHKAPAGPWEIKRTMMRRGIRRLYGRKTWRFRPITRRGPHPKKRENSRRNRCRTGLFPAFPGPSNLDGSPLSPYTSAVPANGRDFGPPRGA